MMYTGAINSSVKVAGNDSCWRALLMKQSVKLHCAFLFALIVVDRMLKGASTCIYERLWECILHILQSSLAGRGSTFSRIMSDQ